MSWKGTIALVLIAGMFGATGIGFYKWGNQNGYDKGHKKGYKEALESLENKTDTIYRFDTIRVIEPRYVTSVIKDSVLVPIETIVRVHDTTYIRLPIEQKTYQDSSFKAIISGYKPSLDYIETYSKNTQIIVPKHWGWSVTFGPSVMLNSHGKIDYGLAVTGGFSWTF